MRAFARVVAEPDGRGGTRLAVLHGESPLLLRRTGGRGGPGVTVHLIGGAAGPLRGDELRLELTVGAGAELEIRSVAAQLALPGRTGLPASRFDIRATVAPGGVLRWLPEPLIAAAGCDHLTTTRVEVAEGGSVLWRDDLVCGRHHEGPGDVTTQTTLRYAGSTVYRHDLAIGPRAPGWSSAAVLGGGRAIGTLLAAGPATARLLPTAIHLPPTAAQPPPTAQLPPPTAQLHPTAQLPPLHPATAQLPPTTARLHSTTTQLSVAGSSLADVAVMPLAGPAVLATAVGKDIRQVRAALDPFCAHLPVAPTPV